MNRLGTIFRIESTKIRKRRLSLVFMIILVAVGIAVNSAMWYVEKVLLPDLQNRMEQSASEAGEAGDTGGANGGGDVTVDVFGEEPAPEITYAEYKQELESQITSAKAALDRNDPTASDRSYRNLLDDLAVVDYKLEKGLVSADEIVPPASSTSGGAWQQLASGSTTSGQMVLTFAIVFMAIVMAGEFEKGTMKSLVIRPVSRSAIFYAKYLAVFVFALFLQGINYLVNLVSSGILFGFGNPTEPVIIGLMGGVVHLPAWGFGLLFYVVEVLGMLLPLAITLLIAVATRANAGTIAISLLIVYLINPVAEQLGGFMPGIRFTPFVHMNPELYLVQGIRIDYTNIVFTIVAALLYTLACLLSAQFIFKKRDI